MSPSERPISPSAPPSIDILDVLSPGIFAAAVAPASMSALSFVEQGSTPEDAAREAHAAELERGRVAAELDALNQAYEARFGFRYCVFVAGRTRDQLLPDFRAALGADRDAEIRRAVDAVIDIARDRHARLTAGAGEAGR